MAKLKTKVGFWATKCGYTWSNHKAKIVNNKLLKAERELEKIRDYLFENFTDYKPKVKKRRKNKKYLNSKHYKKEVENG